MLGAGRLIKLGRFDMPRNAYKYHFKRGHKTLHTGITTDLERREQEHQRTYGDNGHITKVGHATTLDAALKWEREQTERGMPTRRQRVK